MLFQPRMKFICAALSLPVPPESCDEVKNEANGISSDYVDQKPVKKLLLVGCDQSGTSTIFKQVIYFWEAKKCKIFHHALGSNTEHYCLGLFYKIDPDFLPFVKEERFYHNFIHSFIHDCVWFL